MVTRAQSLEYKSADIDYGVKPAKCVIKVGKSETPGTKALARLVNDGLDLKRNLDLIKQSLDAINAQIADAVADHFGDDLGTVHVLAGYIDCAITKKDSVQITDGEALQKVLGKRFYDLVRVKMSYAPERRLVDIAVDGDDPLSKKVARYLAIKPAKPYVKYSLK